MARIGMIFLIVAAALPSRAFGWQMNEFMISFWGGPRDEPTARAIVGAHFNTVMCKAEMLELCRKHGLKAIVMDATPEMAAQLRGNPAVWGYYVKDEPTAEQFPAVGEKVAALRRADPTHPAYVNLMAWMNLEQYLRIVKPDFLSYDYYQWWWGPHNHFWRLEAHREAALQAGIPLICWVEVNADKRWEHGEAGATYLPDNMQRIRQSVYTSLAYGVKGIQWFNGRLVFQRDADGNATPALTPAGEDVAAINAQLQMLGPVLVKLRSVGVFHTRPLPGHTQPIPSDCWIQTRARALVLGLFKDQMGTDYVMVVNRQTNHRRRARLQFQRPVERVEMFDRQDGKWNALALDMREGLPVVSFILNQGDGELLRVRW